MLFAPNTDHHIEVGILRVNALRACLFRMGQDTFVEIAVFGFVPEVTDSQVFKVSAFLTLGLGNGAVGIRQGRHGKSLKSRWQGWRRQATPRKNTKLSSYSRT